MSTIKNGMKVVVCKDVTLQSAALIRLQKSQRPIALGEHIGGSCVVKDTDVNNPNGELVLIKGIGEYSTEFFEEYVETQKTYQVIVQTENVYREGGTYQTYDDVVEHTEEAHGVRIETTNTEYFHPWSFDGDIRTLITKK